MGTRHETPVSLTVKLLGGFDVLVGGTCVPTAAWRLSKARTLLKVLALSPHHRMPRDQVVDVLWPDLDLNAGLNNLYQTVHAVRSALRTDGGLAELRMRGGVVALHPDGEVVVDVDQFEQAALHARRSDDPGLYHNAIRLYAGKLLPDDRYEDWAVWRRESLHSTYMRLLLEVARRHDARGEVRRAIEALEQAVASEPAFEEAHVSLMRLFAATGQRSRALRQYEVLREVLAAELDTEPDPDTITLYEAILSAGGEASERGTIERPRHNLPLPLSSFIGRVEEDAALREQLRATRMLTLTGVGGAGKTRMALHLGWGLLDAYPDGVWQVRLEALSARDSLPQAVANAVGLHEPGHGDWMRTLVDFFRDQRALLILDNCEHLATQASELATELLLQCAQVQILATSRVRLQVPGAGTAVLPPLAVPPSDATEPEVVERSEAVRLFVERARYRRAGFAVTPRNAALVTRICRDLSGIPLAIELAAARTGALSLEQVAARLTGMSGLLGAADVTEGRHRTLQAALDWSYELLDAEARRVVRLASVFEGGWLLEHLERLIGEAGEAHVVDVLSRLVDSSLVSVEGAPDEMVRYRLLEPVREYAATLLREAGETEGALRSFISLCVEIAEDFERQRLQGPNTASLLQAVDAEYGNLRAAIHLCIDRGDIESGLRMVSAVGNVWWVRGRIAEGRGMLEPLLELGGADEQIPAPVRAGAFNVAGALAFFQTDNDTAAQFYERCLLLRRREGDRRGVAVVLSNLALVRKNQGRLDDAVDLLEQARAINIELDAQDSLAHNLGNLGIVAQERGEYERAEAYLHSALELNRRQGDAVGAMRNLNNLGGAAMDQGRFDQAKALLEESHALAIELDMRRSLFASTANLGHIARHQGDLRTAATLYRDAIQLAREQGEVGAIAEVLEGIGAALSHLLRPEDAVAVFACADSIRTATAAPRTPVDEARVSGLLTALREQLGPVPFDGAWSTGMQHDVDEAIAFANARLASALP